MLMIEHELSVVERCCDRVIVMARGLKLAEGTMADHRANDEVRPSVPCLTLLRDRTAVARGP